MILITTPTGQTGTFALSEVMRGTQAVRIMVRDAGKLDPVSRSRCEVVEGKLDDRGALDRALSGVDAAFFCVPHHGQAENPYRYYNGLASAFSDAARAAGVRRLVTISGGVGDGGSEDGIGAVLQSNERIVEGSGAHVRHLRSGYFMENFLRVTPWIARTGAFSFPLAGDIRMPFVAAEDIGRAAGRFLLDDTWTGQSGVAAYGPEPMSCDVLAERFTRAFDRPVRYVPMAGPAYSAILQQHGLGAPMAKNLLAMFTEIARGRDMAAPQAVYADCPTDFESWARRNMRDAVIEAAAESA